METKKLHRSQFVAQTNWRIISFLVLSSKCLLIEGAHNHHIRQPYVSSEVRPTRGERLCTTLRWRHNGSDGVSNHQPHDCLLNHLCRRRSKKTSKLRVTGLCVGNHRGPVNSQHKWPVARKMFPFHDVIMFRVYIYGPRLSPALCFVKQTAVLFTKDIYNRYHPTKYLFHVMSNQQNQQPAFGQ